MAVPRSIFVSFVLSVAMVISMAVRPGAQERRIKITDGKITDLLIKIDPSIPESSTIFGHLQDMLKMVSEAMAESLNLSLTTATIVLPVTWSDDRVFSVTGTARQTATMGDIWVTPNIVSSPLGIGAEPIGGGGCSEPGRYIKMSNSLLNDLMPHHGKLMAASLLQHIFGVFPETPIDRVSYQDADGDEHPATCPKDLSGRFVMGNRSCFQQPGCEFKLQDPSSTSASIMTPAGQQASDAIVCGGSDVAAKQRHNPDSPTIHNHKCFLRSVRQVIQSHPDFDGKALPNEKPTVVPVIVQYVKQTRASRLIWMLEDTIAKTIRFKVARQLYIDHVILNKAGEISLTLIRVCDMSSAKHFVSGTPVEVVAIQLQQWVDGEGLSQGCQQYLDSVQSGIIPAAALGEAMTHLKNILRDSQQELPVTLVMVTNGEEDLSRFPLSYKADLIAVVDHYGAVLHVILTAPGSDTSLLVGDATRYSGRVLMVDGSDPQTAVGGLLPNPIVDVLILLVQDQMRLHSSGHISIPFHLPDRGHMMLVISVPTDQDCSTLQILLTCGAVNSNNPCNQHGALRELGLYIVHLDVQMEVSCKVSITNTGTLDTMIAMSVMLSRDRDTSLPQVTTFKTTSLLSDTTGINSMIQILGMDVTQDGVAIPGAKVKAKVTICCADVETDALEIGLREYIQGAVPMEVGSMYWTHAPFWKQNAVVTVLYHVTLPNDEQAGRNRRDLPDSLVATRNELYKFDTYRITSDSTSPGLLFDPRVYDLHHQTTHPEATSISWKLGFTLYTLQGSPEDIPDLDVKCALAKDPSNLITNFDKHSIEGRAEHKTIRASRVNVSVVCILTQLPELKEQQYLAIKIKQRNIETWGEDISNAVPLAVPSKRIANQMAMIIGVCVSVAVAIGLISFLTYYILKKFRQGEQERNENIGLLLNCNRIYQTIFGNDRQSTTPDDDNDIEQQYTIQTNSEQNTLDTEIRYEHHGNRLPRVTHRPSTADFLEATPPYDDIDIEQQYTTRTNSEQDTLDTEIRYEHHGNRLPRVILRPLTADFSEASSETTVFDN